MQRPSYVLRRLKDKTNTPYCGEGKSIGDIMSEVEKPARRKEIVNSRGDTNTEGVKEQVKRSSHLLALVE